MPERIALDVMTAAADCNHCFDTIPGLERVALGLPKPRWVGERYWAATTRIVIVLLNPGDSTNLGEAWNRRERECFESFYHGGDYQQIREYFRTRRDEERNAATSARPVFSWYENTFSLEFEEIAQLNIAWCASRGNQYRRLRQKSVSGVTNPQNQGDFEDSFAENRLLSEASVQTNASALLRETHGRLITGS